MSNEIVRKIQLFFDLISARLATYSRKMQIRHAYNPMKVVASVTGIIISVVFAVIVVGMVVSRLVFSEKSDTVQSDSEDAIVAVDTVEDIPVEYVFAPFPAIEGHDDMEYLLVGDKYDRVLHLLKKQRGMWGVVKSYPIATGAVEGRKEVRGDKKTPEGEYIIVSRKEDRELNEIYGPLAYVLNYPNREDSAVGRTGDGIWIHGTVPGKMPIDTKGCLEMHNNNILKLSQYLESGYLTPIVIHYDSTFRLSRDLNLQSLWERRERVRKQLSGEVDSVIDLAGNIDTVSVPVEDTVEKVPSEPVEVVEVTPEPIVEDTVVTAEPVIEPIESTPVVPTDDDLIALVEKWRTDWQSMDIVRYESNYDTNRFVSGDYDWSSWRAKKVRTFKNYSEITVRVEGVQVLSVTEDRAVVKFLQKYQSDLFKAENGKQLTLQKSNGKWKIVQEFSVRY